MKPQQLQKYTKEKNKNRPLTEQGAFVPAFSETWKLADLITEETPDVSETYRGILIQGLGLLSFSPSARLMIREAAKQDWEIGIADLTAGCDFHLDVPAGVIVLDHYGLSPVALSQSEHYRYNLLISMIRALRDVWQEKRHGAFDEEYGPEAVLMLERVRAADRNVLAVLVAWELRSENHGDLWRHLVGTEEGDMALAFSRTLEKDPVALYSGKALSAAFNQWYGFETRVNACDHETLEYLDDVIAGNQSGNPFGDKKLKPVAVEVLSCLPDRTAYLYGYGQNIISDPFYAGLGDPINQSHLMQVMRDMRIIRVQGVPFRDASLAAKIFPGGQMTPEGAGAQTVR